MTRALLLAGLLSLSAGACGGRVCVVPTSVEDAREVLEGEWTVRDHTGAEEGAMVFRGDRVSAVWGDVELRGRWTHEGARDNAHRVHLVIDETWEGGTRIQTGTLDEVTLELVFAAEDHLFAMQTDGAWTAWTRVTEIP